MQNLLDPPSEHLAEISWGSLRWILSPLSFASVDYMQALLVITSSRLAWCSLSLPGYLDLLLLPRVLKAPGLSHTLGSPAGLLI